MTQMKKPLNDLSEDMPLGEQLARLRYKQGRTVEGVSRLLNIKKDKIRQLEGIAEETAENDVYLRGYLAQYAEYLDYPVQEALAQYDSLTSDSSTNKGKDQSFLRKFKVKQSIVSSRVFIVSLVTILLLALAGYIFWQVRALATPPNLRLSSPEQEQIIYGSEIEVSGQADKGSEVFVNNQAILTDDSGNFNTIVPLSKGVNEINVRAVNKLGKENIITRTVLLRLPQEATFPEKAVDYVVSEVKANQRSHIVVRADGVVIYEGLLSHNEPRVFRADNKLTFETTDPELFSLRYVNATGIQKEFVKLKQLKNENGAYSIAIKAPMVDETGG